MKCDTKECEKEATVHLTEIVNGNITKLHLCEEHAKQKGVEMEQHFGIADLLQGLAEYSTPQVEAESRKTKCTNCGMGYDDFKKIGRLGCGECYRTFKDSLGPLLKRIHGSNQHIGKAAAGFAREKTDRAEKAEKAEKSEREPASKAPAKSKVSSKASNDLESLKEKLRNAIMNESYEEAAKLRDQIRILEAKEGKEAKEKKSS